MLHRCIDDIWSEVSQPEFVTTGGFPHPVRGPARGAGKSVVGAVGWWREIIPHPYQIQRIRPWRCPPDLGGTRSFGIGAV